MFEPYRIGLPERKEKQMKQANQEPYDILYARLSQEDDREGESNSIQNQRMILEQYANEKGFINHTFCTTTVSPVPISTVPDGTKSCG